MNRLVVGTAGHIDHGKTALVKALTGRDTDRLKEEKRRGISIDLGFAYFDLPNGLRAGFIDVPGHERFVRNMIAGACGIDIALMVVDAAEGVMPQTIEHAEIIGFLGIKEGLVALTKCSQADEEAQELAESDITDKLRGTFFGGKEIIRVDSVSGFGLEKLTSKLADLSESVASRDESAPARIYVDRVFAARGFGVVITGTLSEGTVRQGDILRAYGEKFDGSQSARVKHIQVHDETRSEAYAGQRTALNLSGIEKSDMGRGDQLAADGSLIGTDQVDARITLTARAGQALKERDRLRVYLGSRETFARAYPHTETRSIGPGESAFCKLRFERRAYVRKGDRFVVRRFSPMETIGGGMIADPSPKPRTKRDAKRADSLAIGLEGSDADAVEIYLKNEAAPQEAKKISLMTALGALRTDSSLKKLADEKKVCIVEGGYIHAETLGAYGEKIREALSKFHRERPLLPGMEREALRAKAALPLKSRGFDEIAGMLVGEGGLGSEGTLYFAPGFVPKLTDWQQKTRGEIEKLYADSGFAPPELSKISVGEKWREVFDSMVRTTLIPLGGEIFLHASKMEAAKDMIRRHCEANGSITLAEFRDMTGSSRKYCLAILEYLDGRKFTLRDGDRRVLKKG
ncbi:MAG: selenocysteine-specific translation elongation factor [Defluviitaleaceae bacterium]|nr:selenocysteine-specific translation elongation factor [Defluviitaleaceae bacterium]